jgi:hypothetical protein
MKRVLSGKSGPSVSFRRCCAWWPRPVPPVGWIWSPISGTLGLEVREGHVARMLVGRGGRARCRSSGGLHQWRVPVRTEQPTHRASGRTAWISSGRSLARTAFAGRSGTRGRVPWPRTCRPGQPDRRRSRQLWWRAPPSPTIHVLARRSRPRIPSRSCFEDLQDSLAGRAAVEERRGGGHRSEAVARRVGAPSGGGVGWTDRDPVDPDAVDQRLACGGGRGGDPPPAGRHSGGARGGLDRPGGRVLDGAGRAGDLGRPVGRSHVVAPAGPRRASRFLLPPPAGDSRGVRTEVPSRR